MNSLFSLDKLAASGRVKVITTEEFFEQEALTGKLGIAPSEEAKRLDVKVTSLLYCLYLPRPPGRSAKTRLFAYCTVSTLSWITELQAV